MCIGSILPAREPELTLCSTAVPFDATGLTGVSLFSKMSKIKIHDNTIRTV